MADNVKMFGNRKAVVEVQFNWIFILIVGGLLLLFFGGFIVKQKQAADIKLSSQVITDLEAVLIGAGVSAGAAELIEIPDIPIAITCDKFGIKDVEKPISKANPIFGPNLIKGNFLVTWTKPWDIPFRVTNFLFVTTPQVRYVLVGAGDFAEDVFNELPPRTITYDEEPRLTMNKEMLADISAMENLKNYKVRFVFFGQQDLTMQAIPEKLASMPDEDITAVAINGDFNFGQVDFYVKSGDTFEKKGSSAYLGDTTLFGAIFAEDIETYECVMNKAFTKLNIVAGIYLDRVLNLFADYSSDPVCSTYYEDGAYFDAIKAYASAGFSANAAVGMKDLPSLMKVRNDNIARASCVSIY